MMINRILRSRKFCVSFVDYLDTLAQCCPCRPIGMSRIPFELSLPVTTATRSCDYTGTGGDLGQ